MLFNTDIHKLLVDAMILRVHSGPLVDKLSQTLLQSGVLTFTLFISFLQL
eukprot:m.49671 g.49671  ORF g.49671 m.49671 type:complete len:50 (+) comp12492_c0_seq1:186-335(+)